MKADSVSAHGREKHSILVLLLLFCVPVIFLFSRVPPDGSCLRTVTWAKSAHFVHQCDSFSITTMDDNLEGFATSPNPWRSRPGYILMVTAIGQALSPVATAIRFGLLQGRLRGDLKVDVILRRYPYYFGMTVVNFLVLGVGLWLAFKLAGPRPSYLAPALGAVVVSSDLVHAMIWSFHPSFINLIVPVSGIFFFLQGCRAPRLAWSEVATLGLVLAFGLLNYGFLAICVPCFACGWLFWAWCEGEGKRATARGACSTVMLAVVAFAPVLIWGEISESVFHLSASYEASTYRQFVWVLDGWKAGNLADMMSTKWTLFFPQTLLWMGWPGAFAVVFSIVLIVIAPRKRARVRWIRDPILVGVVVTVFGMFAFNFLQGYYQPRLTNSVTLAFFVAMARIAIVTGQENRGRVILLTGAGLQIALAFISPAVTMT